MPLHIKAFRRAVVALVPLCLLVACTSKPGANPATPPGDVPTAADTAGVDAAPPDVAAEVPAAADADAGPAVCGPHTVPLKKNGMVVDPCGCCEIAPDCEGYFGGSPNPGSGCTMIYDAAPPCVSEIDENGCPVLNCSGSCLVMDVPPSPDVPDAGGGADAEVQQSQDVASCPGAATAVCAADIPPWDGPQPGAALLPGESTACQALGIAACAFYTASGDPWGKNYACFDVNGKLVFKGGVDAMSPDAMPAEPVPPDLPCSWAQLQAWIMAFDNPCWMKIQKSSLPPSVVMQVLDMAKVPDKVCSNVAGTRFQWSVDCTLAVYEIDCYGAPSTLPGPPFCTYMGGNSTGSRWKLTISPPPTDLFAPGHPFLSCCDFNVGGELWDFSVNVAGAALVLFASDVHPGGGGPSNWLNVPAKIDAMFTTCGTFFDGDGW